MSKKETETHPSYGMLQFSRVSWGKDTTLFASSIPHRETIRLRICPGIVRRNLNRYWYHADEGKTFIEVEMSFSQFTEAITSMNQGSGVPVTIRRLNGKGVEEVEFVNQRRLFEGEFANSMEKLEGQMQSTITNAEDLLSNKKSLTKSDRESILKDLAALKQQLASNIPFVFSQFNEQMDNTVMESKAEFEAFVMNKLTQLGLESMEQLIQLGNNPSQTFKKIEEK